MTLAPILLEVYVNDKDCQTLLDTGCAKSLVNEQLSRGSLKRCESSLVTISGDEMMCHGVSDVHVRVKNDSEFFLNTIVIRN